MYDVITPTRPLPDIPEDEARDLELAERAAAYLDSQGLDRAAVVRCLVDEFDLDPSLATRLAATSN